MLPSLLSAQVQDGLEEFLRASFASNVPGFDTMIDRFMDEPGALMRGPYVSLKLPFRPGAAKDGRHYFSNISMPWRPHAHQVRAFEQLGQLPRQSTLVATGTGSGKTESFLLPILDACVQQQGTPGIKAILIYPMNALATDQARRLAELIHDTAAARGKVTAGLYIGQKEDTPSVMMTREQLITDRDTMRKNPPDILLTNYKMLDYMLLRPEHKDLWRNNNPETLQFLVVDEIHTFDGAQGTDLACLVRRLKHRLSTPDEHLCCVGTSATLGGEGARAKLVAYASQIFGERFSEDAIVGEERLTRDEFLGAKEYFRHPREDEITEELDPSRYSGEQAYLRAALRAWFDVPVKFEDELWRVQLGHQLREHMFLDRLLARLDGSILELSSLIERLQDEHKSYRAYSYEQMELLITSFLALVSIARREVTETALQRAKRIEEERPPRLIPFLQVQFQIWQRELRRMVASVEDKPKLAFHDDLNGAERTRHLPVIYCPHCSLMGWASLIRAEQRDLSCDLRDFYTAFFSHDTRVAFFFPHDSLQEGVTQQVELDYLTLQTLKEAPKEGVSEKHMLVRRAQSEKGREGSKRTDQTCPRCGAHEALTLLGYRAATLTSAHINQLMGSRYNDHKKLLTFSDSVQDAAHRAGFFGARTWRHSMRTGVQQALDTDGVVTLSELADKTYDHWSRELGEDGFTAAFMPPELEVHRDYAKLLEQDTLPASSPLPNLVKKRLDWEIALEYSLNSRAGQSLPRVMASAMGPDDVVVESAIDAITELLPNRIGFSSPPSREEVSWFVWGVITRLVEQGAVLADTMPQNYIETLGKQTYQAFYRQQFMPNYGPDMRLPRLAVAGRTVGKFDHIGGTSEMNWWRRWFQKVLATDGRLVASGDQATVYELVLRQLEHVGVVQRQDLESSTVWGLDPGAMQVEADVGRVCCDVCHRQTHVPRRLISVYDGSACHALDCAGTLHHVSAARGHAHKLYTTGELVRVVTAEHTGLLERQTRQDIEAGFKAAGEFPWKPNLLSCTPTLEMGIDIGDLSCAILCSVPPAQANYLQRVGRAGRRDGNSLIVTLAGGRTHDMYFFHEPLDMIDGEVRPPGIYLSASAVLERQLTAFCLDSWVAGHQGASTLTGHVSTILTSIGTANAKGFPYDFLNFIKTNATRLIDAFLHMFDARDVLPHTRQILADYIHNTGRYAKRGGMSFDMVETFEQLRKDRDSLRRRANALTPKIKDLEARQQTSRLSEPEEEQLEEMKGEQKALRIMADQINKTGTLEHLTHEGILPNYAFPEQGVTLRSIIWRKREGKGKRKYERSAYEYVRPATQALSELAPHSTFFAEGHQVKIDQIDVSDSSVFETWRFCPTCSHAEHIDVTQDPHDECPACGDQTWRDNGQRLRMLRLRQVFASMEDGSSRISDTQDDRNPRFYTRQLLVEIAEESEKQGWFLDNDEVPFGVEYASKVILRDINFGERTDKVAATSIGGESKRRKGFKVCVGCGKVQDPMVGQTVTRRGKATTVKEIHEYGCKKKVLEPCLYLYRELVSEGLRILLPFLDGVSTERSRHSFLAAFQMGLEDAFGGDIGHLRATMYTEPTPEEGVRKTFLMLYDVVPGGTGYLKELARDEQKVLEIMEAARARLQRCECQKDPDKDGCYRCLFAYRNSYEQSDVSRDHAIDLLGKVLAHRGSVKPTDSLGHVRVTGALDSVLEAMFVEALHQIEYESRKCTLTREIFSGRKGWRLRWKSDANEDETTRDVVWNVKVHERLGAPQGVVIDTEPDFVLEPVRGSQEGRKSVAVYLDGWMYHKNQVTDDFLKRRAIFEADNHRVWSMDYHDIDSVLDKQKPRPAWFPSSWKGASGVDKRITDFGRAFGLDLSGHARRSNFDLLVEYMLSDVSERDFELRALSYYQGLLSFETTRGVAMAEHVGATALENASRLAERYGELEHMMSSTYRADRSHLYLFCGQRQMSLGQGAPGIEDRLNTADVLVVLDNRVEADVDREHERARRDDWKGLLGAQNVLQFLPNAVFLASHEGRDTDATNFELLEIVQREDEQFGQDPSPSDGEWFHVYADALDEEKEILHVVWRAQLEPPELGLPLEDERGRPAGLVDLGWESQRVGVVFEADGIEKLRDAGWRVWLADELAPNLQVLVEALQGA